MERSLVYAWMNNERGCVFNMTKREENKPDEVVSAIKYILYAQSKSFEVKHLCTCKHSKSNSYAYIVRKLLSNKVSIFLIIFTQLSIRDSLHSKFG
jgi:hypothetical protein